MTTSMYGVSSITVLTPIVEFINNLKTIVTASSYKAMVSDLALIMNPLCANPFGLDDGGWIISMLGNDASDFANIITNLSPTSAMWG